MSENTYHDKDHVAVLSAVSSSDGKSIVLPWADPTTHRLLTTGTSSGATGTWYDVTGVIDGVNDTFTIPVVPTGGIVLNLGGQLQVDTKWYVLSGSTITYQSGYIPAAGIPTDEHKAFVIS